MANFSTAFALTMGNEGGYANNPADKGGETYKGIARNFNPTWAGWVPIDDAKKVWPVAKLDAYLSTNSGLQSRVVAFYKTNYWDVNQLDQVINQAIANELFDTGVNMGTGIAARMVQEALNLTNNNQRLYPDMLIDGAVGPKTLGLLNNHPRPSLIYKLLNVLQGERYLTIMRHAPAQEVFCASWLSRIDFQKV